MAWIRNQYYGNTETAVVPSDMPPYTPQIAGLTSEVLPSGSTNLTIRSGHPTIGSTNIECEFNSKATTVTASVTGRTHMTFTDGILDVSGFSSLKLYASLRRQLASSSRPLDYVAYAKYKGSVVATSNTQRITTSSSTGLNSTLTIDLTGISRIDEIVLDVSYPNGYSTSAAYSTGWRFYSSQSNYIKFIS